MSRLRSRQRIAQFPRLALHLGFDLYCCPGVQCRCVDKRRIAERSGNGFGLRLYRLCLHWLASQRSGSRVRLRGSCAAMTGQKPIPLVSLVRRRGWFVLRRLVNSLRSKPVGFEIAHFAGAYEGTFAESSTSTGSKAESKTHSGIDSRESYDSSEYSPSLIFTR